MIDLDKLKALEQAATPGPWESRKETVKSSRGRQSEDYFTIHDSNGCWVVGATVDLCMATERGDQCTNDMTNEDAAFIAEARTAVPELIAEVERLQGEIKYLRGDAKYYTTEDGEPNVCLT